MNWEMIGAIGEILGAGGVIATLAYLSRQIRASTRATRRAAMQEVLDQSNNFLGHLGASPEMAALWIRGMRGDDDLSAEERIQFWTQVYRWTLTLERFHHMALAGDIEPWIVENNLRIRRDIVPSPGYQAWYRERSHWLSDSFRAALEQDMAARTGVPVGYGAVPGDEQQTSSVLLHDAHPSLGDRAHGDGPAG